MPIAAAKPNVWRARLATDVIPKDAVWDSAALEGNYELLDMAFEAAAQQVTWTLRTRPRGGAGRDFFVALYDRLGRPINEAPLAWSKGRRESGTVHLASLDLAWTARRLGGRAKDVALVAVQRYDAREYGRSRDVAPRGQRLARLPRQFATKALPETVQWDPVGLESCYEVLNASLDASSGRVVWQLEAQPRTYPGRAFRAVGYDAAGKPISELPLLWSDGRLDRRKIAVAELDAGYLADQLKDRAKALARVVIERYED